MRYEPHSIIECASDPNTMPIDSIDDWMLVNCGWPDEGGRIKHEARRRLQRDKSTSFYKNDGSRQRVREIVQCSFSIALDALSDCIGDNELSSVWQ